MLRILTIGLALLLLVAPARAQLPSGVPGVGAPELPVGVPGRLPSELPGLDAPIRPADAALRNARRIHVRELIRDEPRSIEADPRGEPAVRGEVVAISTTPAALDAARGAGFTIAGEISLEQLGPVVVRLATPAGMSTVRALRRLRRLDPEGVYDFNHVYTPGGEVGSAGTPAPAGPSDAVAPGLPGNPRIGLVDGGVDATHPALAAAMIHRSGCDGRLIVSDHGTAIASLIVGHTTGFSGVAPSATLYSADVYCAAPTGGNVLALAAALSWLMSEDVRVINVSLVGPPNATLERIIAHVVRSGVIVVAAVGNDGPAAPPLYPAAYPGVVAVTGVDSKRRVLLEACRGRHVGFAAPGAEMAVASGASFVTVRGTSFAAPIVAALLALEMRGTGDPADAAQSRLAAGAIDLGRQGRDETYGAGLVGEPFRTNPETLVNRDAP